MRRLAMIALVATICACNEGLVSPTSGEDLSVPIEADLAPANTDLSFAPDFGVAPDLRPTALSLEFMTSYIGMGSQPGFGTGNFAVADLDRDGHLDLVDANFSLFHGHGDGTFTMKGAIAQVGTYGQYVVASDFNHDGWPDIAATNENGSAVLNVVLGDQGSFKAVEQYPAAWSEAGLAAADFDGDGFLDLAVADFALKVNGEGINGMTVSIFSNDRKGHFGAKNAFASHKNPVYLAAADFDGNGLADLVMANEFESPNHVSVMLSQGKGQLAPYTDLPVQAGGILATGDFNGDGHLDIVFPSGHVIIAILGRGDGTFGPPVPFDAGPSMLSYFAIAVADFNADGALDVAVQRDDGHYTVVILPGRGDGTFDASHGVTAMGMPCCGDGSHDGAMATGDFNEDGKPDLVISHSDTLAVLLNVSR